MRQLTLLPNFAALQWCLSTPALGTPQPGYLFVVGATCVLWVSAVSMVSLHPPDTSRCPNPAVLMRCVSSCCWRFVLVGRMEPLPRTPICRRNAQQRNRHLLVVRAPVSWKGTSRSLSLLFPLVHCPPPTPAPSTTSDLRPEVQGNRWMSKSKSIWRNVDFGHYANLFCVCLKLTRLYYLLSNSRKHKPIEMEKEGARIHPNKKGRQHCWRQWDILGTFFRLKRIQQTD